MNRTPTLPRFIYPLIVVAFFASFGSQRVTAQATSFTVSGTVTNANGQRLADVMVIMVSDAIGTQIVFTDQNGNYVLTDAGGASHSVNVLASKSGFFFDPLSKTFISIGVVLSGSETINFVGTASPIPLPILQSPILMTQKNSLQALTLESVTWMSEPFGVTNTTISAPTSVRASRCWP